MERTDVSGDTDTADAAKAAEQAVKTGNAEDSGLAAAKRAYDASCKRLLADRSVLARILKGSLQEYLDFDVSVIAEFCIEREAQIGSVPVLPDSGKADLNGNFGTSRSPKERTQNESAQPEGQSARQRNCRRHGTGPAGGHRHRRREKICRYCEKSYHGKYGRK